MPNITFVEDSKYHTLPRYFFTDNPIDIMLYSSNMWAVEAQKGKLVLKLYKPSGMSAEGATLVLKFPGHELVFRQYDSPDESGLQLPRYQTGYFGNWVNGFFNGLASNPDLATYFTLALTDESTSAPLITIEARETGEDYDLSYTESESTIPGIYPVGSGSTYQEGITGQRKGNYKMLCQVLNRANDELFGSDLLTPNDAGEALFRVSEYLRPNVPAPTPWPKPSEAIYELLNDNVMSFYIRFAESYDGKTYIMYDSRYYIFLALAGGLGWYDYKRMSGLGVQYFNDATLAKRFLDWAPATLTVAPDQPIRLAFLIKYAGAYSIKRVVTFTDGSTQSLSESITATDVSILQMYLGHNETGLASVNPAKTVKQIQVSVYNVDDTPLLVSDVRTYIFDRAPALDSEFLLWRNAFGRYQTLWLNASRNEESKIEREEAELTLQYDATPDTPQYTTHSHLETQTVKHATGWLSTDDADWLRDFMLSKEVYRIRRQNYLERITIRNSKLVTHDTDDSLISLEVEYQPTHRDARHSNAQAYVQS